MLLLKSYLKILSLIQVDIKKQKKEHQLNLKKNKLNLLKLNLEIKKLVIRNQLEIKKLLVIRNQLEIKNKLLNKLLRLVANKHQNQLLKVQLLHHPADQRSHHHLQLQEKVKFLLHLLPLQEKEKFLLPHPQLLIKLKFHLHQHQKRNDLIFDYDKLIVIFINIFILMKYINYLIKLQ